MNEPSTVHGRNGTDTQRTWKAVYTIVERPGAQKKFWVRIGTAFVNHDQSINVRLDASPTNGQLQIRDADPYDPSGLRRRFPTPTGEDDGRGASEGGIAPDVRRCRVRRIVGRALALALGLSLAGTPQLAGAEERVPSTGTVTGNKPSADGVVNVTSATAEELERLPGIGPSKAKAIVEHRHTHPFHKVEEMTKVKGIGRKTLLKLRPYLTVAGPTTLRERPSTRSRR